MAIKKEAVTEEAVTEEAVTEEAVTERDNAEVLDVENVANFEVAGISPGKQGRVSYGVFKSVYGLVEL